MRALRFKFKNGVVLANPVATSTSRYKTRSEFSDIDSYAQYVKDNLKLGMKVRAREDSFGVCEGEIGTFERDDGSLSPEFMWPRGLAYVNCCSLEIIGDGEHDGRLTARDAFRFDPENKSSGINLNSACTEVVQIRSSASHTIRLVPAISAGKVHVLCYNLPSLMICSLAGFSVLQNPADWEVQRKLTGRCLLFWHMQFAVLIME